MSKKKQQLEERLSTLQQKQAQLKSQIKIEENKAKKRKRKQDNRRKIIIGALAAHHMEKNPNTEFTRILARLIDEYVIRNEDRQELFGLDPLPEHEINARKNRHTTHNNPANQNTKKN